MDTHRGRRISEWSLSSETEAFRFLLFLFSSTVVVIHFRVLQVTCQDISTMIRGGQRSIIFLLNNGGYTIEEEIHEGPYNVIKNWNYTAFVEAIHNQEGKCWTCKVSFSFKKT